MRTILALSLSTFLTAASGIQAENALHGDAILAMGAYVPTNDMASSEAFYQTLFDREPVIQLDDFVAFDVAGGWFAIVSRDRYAPDSVPGTGSVPYLQSGDLEQVRARAAQTGLSMPEIAEEPGIRLLKFIDPNGQPIEFFMLTGR